MLNCFIDYNVYLGKEIVLQQNVMETQLQTGPIHGKFMTDFGWRVFSLKVPQYIWDELTKELRFFQSWDELIRTHT